MRPLMRAYSHQGHGPRADQTGRIHISDFRFLRTISLAKRSRSIHLGQMRKFNASKQRVAQKKSERVGGGTFRFEVSGLCPFKVARIFFGLFVTLALSSI